MSQSQFSSFKSKKIWDTILLEIDLTGIGAYISQNLNTKLDLIIWTSQFLSSKGWKTRETNILW